MRIRTALLSFVCLLLLTTLISLPQWIPSWAKGMGILLVALLVLAFAAGVFLVLGIHARVKRKKKSGMYTAISMLLLAALWLFNGLFCGLVFGQGMFGGRYARHVTYSQYNTTIYLYDVSFMEQSTAIKEEDETFPVMKNIGSFYHVNPEEVFIGQQAHNLVITAEAHVLEYDMSQRKVVREEGIPRKHGGDLFD